MKIKDIKSKLEQKFQNGKIEVFDSRGTGDHFSLIVISNDFEKIPLIERHRMIYSIFEQEITKEIHALQIQTYTKSEWKQKNK
tara:strand:+ start:180 stop:428 length:249 start_codon:yes stop_codon:yes gene_type:complete